LNNQLGDCAGCPEQSVMRKLVRQYQKGQPRWWVVDNVVVVPIWMVELMRRAPEI
jgi:hypothetical protein